MPSEIVTSDQQPQISPLGDRLDASIGETSNGIGAMLSELVRRSLKMGVSDIGETLVEYAEEQVEAAVQQQMPGITEAADAVAQSTSNRVVRQAVDELNEKTQEHQRVLETKIDAAETKAFDRSREHLETALNVVNDSIDQTRTLAVEGNDSSDKKIQELREKARHTWRKLREEFSSVHDAHESLRHEYSKLGNEHAKLGEVLGQVRQMHQQHTQATEEKFTALMMRNQQLEERLAILEQPRGIKGLIAKFRGGSKAATELDAADLAAEESGESDPTA